MTVKELINKLEEQSQLLESGLDSEVLVTENWFTGDAMFQDIRSIIAEDIIMYKIDETCPFRVMTDKTEGIVIGQLNQIVK